MHQPDSIDGEAVRERVILFLQLLSSKACLHACEERIPAEQLAYQLCSLWFNVIYWPSTRYMDSLRGDYSEARARQFEDCFTPAERAALERFHRFLELRVDMIPPSSRGRKEFPQNDAWEQIIKDAGYLLEALEPEPSRRPALEEFLPLLFRP